MSLVVGLREALENTDHRRGYGQFVIGELCMQLGDYQSAIGYFEDFVVRVTQGRVAMQVTLQSEIRRAKKQLVWLRKRRVE